jgi:hypothetical protein
MRGELFAGIDHLYHDPRGCYRILMRRESTVACALTKVRLAVALHKNPNLTTDNTDLHGSKKFNLGLFLSSQIRVIRVHPW